MKKKCIIFDMMGVIFTVGDDTNELLVPFVQNLNKDISREEINRWYLSASKGEISSEIFWNKVGLNKSTDNRNIEEDYLNNCLTIDEDFIECARKIKKTYRISILSNDLKEWSEYLRIKHGINDYVNLSVISGEEGVRKADKKIYEIALAKLDIDARNCVFIDDRYKNLIPAMDLGMQVILFERAGQSEKKSSDIKSITSFSQLEDVLDRMEV